jgi:PAS domain S-box-containing protein
VSNEDNRADQALASSEQELRLVLQTIPALVWRAGPEGIVECVNKRVLEYFGAPLDEIIGWGWMEKVHPDDPAFKVSTWLRNLESGNPRDAACRLRGADGRYRWFEVRGEPLRASDGTVLSWYGVLIDIDDRRKAEDRLRRSEAYLAEAQRLSHTGSAAYNETAILYWSEEASRTWGFDPLQGIPSREAVWQRIHPDDLDRVNENIEHGVREKRSFANEFRLMLPDGTVKHIEAINYPVVSASGELLEIVVTGIDVTDRKRAEQALRESEAKFRDYAETASDWFWEIGPEYKLTLLTENAFGSRAAGRIGTACWDHALDLETEPEKWRLLRQALEFRKPFRDFVFCSAHGNESPIYVKASGKPVFDSNGAFCGYRGTGTDVTAIKRAQEEHERLRQLESDLAHMNRLDMIGQQTASLAHEITQPIAAGRNYARAALNFLDQQPPDLDEVKKQLGCVVGAADRSGEIIERIRDHIKKAPPRKARFDLNDAIDEVIALGRSAITRNGVSVQTLRAEGLAPVEGDRVQLQQVVLNLILNAVEAMGSVEAGARELLISTEQNQAKGVLVAVRDSGPGIDPENLERIFEPFYTTKTSGMGMGLSICRSIIDNHGGRLWAGVNEPRGAVFQFTLPDAGKEIMDPRPAALHARERCEDSTSDHHHPLAYEDSRRPRRSGRVPDRRRLGGQ